MFIQMPTLFLSSTNTAEAAEAEFVVGICDWYTFKQNSHTVPSY